MLKMVSDVLRDLETDRSIASRTDLVASLRGRVGLDDFGEVLLTMPNAAYPRLSRLLPAMASNAVQDRWTGRNGYELLRQTANFVRSVAYNSAKLSGRVIEQQPMLDYGCGYGRIARLMWFFSDPEKVFGVDPWDASIRECDAAGMGPNFVQSDYLPERLPVGDTQFAIAYAFSVFTHLSLPATLKALAAVRRHMRRDGIFTITIRPVEYWEIGEQLYKLYRARKYEEQHQATGFAFFPHQIGSAGQSEQTYGDTSMSLDWIKQHVPDWQVAGIDRSLEDAYQLYVFLRAI